MDNVDHISEFIAAMKSRRNLSSRTLKAYESDLRAFQRFLADKRVIAVGTADVQAFVSQLEDDNLRAASIKRKLATIRVFLGFLQAECIIDQIPLWRSGGRFRCIS